MGEFRGWPKSAIDFYKGLEKDNSKAYWTAHKKTYEADVRGPMEELIDALEPEFGEASIFRPFRDTRFSANKDAYKTNVAAAIGGFGTPAYYVSVSARGLETGGGLHSPAPDQLVKLRSLIDDSKRGPQLEKLIASITDQGLELQGETVKTAPRGYSVDHPRIELLRQKWLVVMNAWPVQKWLHTDEALDRVRDTWRAARPLNEWIAKHVGPPAQEQRRHR